MLALAVCAALSAPAAPGPVTVEPWEWPEGVMRIRLDEVFEGIVIEIAATDFVAFHDHTGPNPDGPEVGNGQINYAAVGEWLEYEVWIPFTSKWHVALEYANPGAGGEVMVSLMGQQIGPIPVMQTDGWLQHRWVSVWWPVFGVGATFPQTLRVTNVAASDDGWTGDLRRIVLFSYADKSP